MNAVQKIAETLGETVSGPLRAIERLVKGLGEEPIAKAYPPAWEECSALLKA